MVHASLTRYVPIVDDPDAFLNTLAQPLPTCIWANPLKTSSTQVESMLTAQGLAWDRIAWHPGAYRVHAWPKPGRSLPFICGWYGVQEEIAMTAVSVLAPQPGDRILDLCAAPGGKTAQLSLSVGADGMVMANERSISRLSSLWSTISRLGLTNVLTRQGDGRDLAVTPHSFDRVLVDVPCSGEGTLRKKAGRRSLDHENWNPARSARLTAIQRQLLDRALSLVKPGGVLVYSTCTFAPEENEAIIDAVLGDRGYIEPYPLAGLTSAPGISQWQGQAFRADSRHAQRYWPHLNNTGGFFVARIRRTEVALVSEVEPIARDGGGDASGVTLMEDREALEWFCDRFGLDRQSFDSYQLWSTGKEKQWIANTACVPPSQGGIDTIGLPFVRRTPHGFKPTTSALQRFGAAITRQYLELDPAQCQTFIQGESQPCANEHNEPGFIYVRSGLYELGCGRWKAGELHSQLPKFLWLPE